MNDPFEQYFKQRWKALRKRLILPSDALTPKVFHRMRVEMKRINALFALVAFHDPNFDRRKRFAPFRSLFKQMGKIRDLDVEAELLEQYGLGKREDPYGRFLQKQKSRQLEKFIRQDRPRLVQKLDQSARIGKILSAEVERRRLATLSDRNPAKHSTGIRGCLAGRKSAP